MTLRRDFSAFAAGAIVARTVLPIGAGAAPPDKRTEFLAVFRQLGDAEQVAVLRGLKRHRDGAEFGAAMRGDYADLGRAVPGDVEEVFSRLCGAA